jgi:septal ring factor EnvC (AmiA/AmiB activator)
MPAGDILFAVAQTPLPEVGAKPYDREPVPWLADAAHQDSTAGAGPCTPVNEVRPTMNHMKKSLDQLAARHMLLEEDHRALQEEYRALQEEHELLKRTFETLEEDRHVAKRALELKHREIRELHQRNNAQAAELQNLKKHLALYCTTPYQSSPLSVLDALPKRKNLSSSTLQLFSTSMSSALHSLPMPASSSSTAARGHLVASAETLTNPEDASASTNAKRARSAPNLCTEDFREYRGSTSVPPQKPSIKPQLSLISLIAPGDPAS